MQTMRQRGDSEATALLSIGEAKMVELPERRDRLYTMIALLAEFRDCGCEAVASCDRAVSMSPADR
jgi:hypothetical protein